MVRHNKQHPNIQVRRQAHYPPIYQTYRAEASSAPTFSLYHPSMFIDISLWLVVISFLPSRSALHLQPSSSNGTQLNVWNRVATGVEVRNEDWKNAAGDDDTVTIVRFDTHKIKVSVGYQPGQPMSMNDWMQQEHPLAIINGGYFDQQFNATALVVSNGKVFGQSYTGFGGMLSVNSHGIVKPALLAPTTI